MELRCGTCRANRGELAAPGGVVYQDDYWRLEHVLEPVPLAGWLVLKPLRHVESVADLNPEESAGLGPLLQRISAALTDILQPTRVYVCLFAEAEGFSHIHFHIIPRPPDLITDLRGPNIFDLMSQAHAEQRNLVPLDSAIAITEQVRGQLDGQTG